MARTQLFTLGVPRSFVLSSDGSRLLFLRSRGSEDRLGRLWLLEGGQERLLADPDALADAGGQVPEAELVRRERTSEPVVAGLMRLELAFFQETLGQ